MRRRRSRGRGDDFVQRVAQGDETGIVLDRLAVDVFDVERVDSHAALGADAREGDVEAVVADRLADAEEQADLVSQHPFVVYQSLKNAGRFTRSELAGYLEMLAGIDLALKSTGQEPRLLLERFLLAVCKVNA